MTTQTAAITKSIDPVFESIGRRQKLRGFRASLNGEPISTILFDTQPEAQLALDQAAYELASAPQADPPGENPLGDDEGDSAPQAVNWNSATSDASFPICTVCDTNDYPPSGFQPRVVCIACANAQHFELPNRFAAQQLATNEPPAEPAPPVDDGEDDNWGGFRRPLAFTRQSIAIEATMRRCHHCGADHRTWQCPEIRQRLMAEQSWKDIALGRELCRMRWRDFRAFVALLMSIPTAHLVIYAESYIAFLRSYNAASMVTTREVLGVWMRIIADEGDRGPAAPAVQLRAA
jgi:hypothetical protein